MSEFENPNLPENLPEKRIEVVTMRVGDIKTGFGNPRKIGKKKREELKRSLEQFGDFGLFLIDEQDNVIAGNMRHAILNEINPDQEVTADTEMPAGGDTYIDEHIEQENNYHTPVATPSEVSKAQREAARKLLGGVK